MSDLTVTIPIHEVNYNIKIEPGLLNRVGNEIAAIFKGAKIAIITDKTVFNYYGEKVISELEHGGFEVHCIVLPPGEQTKSFQSLPNIYSQLVTFGITRSDLLISLGGGVIGDISGFVASSYLRGIDFIQIPTTLLAQVDSSVGGKVGVDLPEGKNLVGAFYHPKLVLIDSLVLETLSDTSFADGMAEVIKYGCIKDQNFFNRLVEFSSRDELMPYIDWVIETCCTIKRNVVQTDEKDRGERMLLNFGHTLGHAIEAYYHYEKYSHGQAIAIGMVELSRIAEEQHLTQRGTTAKVTALLKQHHLPVELADPADYPDILSYIKKDKKHVEGHLNLVVLNEIGSAKTIQADERFFRSLTLGGIKHD